MRVAVVGASGFVGGVVGTSLTRSGHEVLPVRAPRFRTRARTPNELRREVMRTEDAVRGLSAEFSGCDAVINAAGLAQAISSDHDSLIGANALLPGILQRAALNAGSARFVHISSTAVQGRRSELDETGHYDAFSPYSRSKVLGEQVVLTGGEQVVVYRPPSVHGSDRPVTQQLARFARGSFSSVAGPVARPSPQILAKSLGEAVSFVSTAEGAPRIVMHPWEGMTTESLLVTLGCGREPRWIPSAVAAQAVRMSFLLARVRPGVEGIGRRVELLWFGQRQGSSWLARAGWSSDSDLQDWNALGRELAGGEA